MMSSIQNACSLSDECGIGSEIDEINGFARYEKAAEQGDLDSLAKVGKCFALGIGVAQNLRAAERCFTRAAESGSAQALCTLGAFYLRTAPLQETERQGIACLQRAESLGNKDASFILTNYSLRARKIGYANLPKEYVEKLRSLADDGYVEAQALLGAITMPCHEYKYSTTDKEAKVFLARAAEKGNETAISVLVGYERILHEPGSLTASLNTELIARLCTERNPAAQYFCAREKMWGGGGEGWLQGKKLLGLSAQQGFEEAIDEIKLFYGSDDPKKLYQWHRKAAERAFRRFLGVEEWTSRKNKVRAMGFVKLGEDYEKGYGVQKNGHKALQYFNIAQFLNPEDRKALKGQWRCFSSGVSGEMDVRGAVEAARKLVWEQLPSEPYFSYITNSMTGVQGLDLQSTIKLVCGSCGLQKYRASLGEHDF